MDFADEVERLNRGVDDSIDLVEESDDDALGVRRYDFNSFRTERSIRDLRRWKDIGKIKIPDFQRDFVWDYKQSSTFIESILLGLPVPDLFIFRDIDVSQMTESFVLIDGLQRFTSILQFVDGEYRCGNKSRRFSVANKQSEWAGKTYSDLSEDDKAFFDDYSLKFTVFDSVNKNEWAKRLYMTEIFRRINTGSSRLSDQEIRNAVYAGPAIEMLKSIGTNPAFSELIGDERRYRDRYSAHEFALRVLAYAQVTRAGINGDAVLFPGTGFKLSASRSEVLGNFLFYGNKEIAFFEGETKKFLSACEEVNRFGRAAIMTIRRGTDEVADKLHQVLTESILICLMLGVKICIDSATFIAIKRFLWGHYNNQNPFFASTTSIKNVLRRYIFMKMALEGNFNENTAVELLDDSKSS